MRVRVFFQNIEFSSDVESFVLRRLEGIDHLLSPGHEVNVHIKFDQNFKTLILLNDSHHRYVFSSEAEMLSDSCIEAIHRVGQFLRDQRRLSKKKFDRHFGEISET